MRNDYRATRRGFTLVEVLVVVVIIAIVASMMLLSVNVLGRDNQLTEESQRLMRLRVAGQAIALILLLGALFFFGGRG